MMNPKLAEVLVDMAMQVQAKISSEESRPKEWQDYRFPEDSREIVQSIIAWAEEFEAKYKDIEWGELANDYYIAQEEFTEKKMEGWLR